MKYSIVFVVFTGMIILSSCAKEKSGGPPDSAAEVPAITQSAGAQHASVFLKDGSKVMGTIVASSQTDMVVAGDDGIERKIPLTQIKSVEYGEAQKTVPGRQPSHGTAPSQRAAMGERAPVRQQSPLQTDGRSVPPPAAVAAVRTYELAQGSEISVRTNEAIDSATAAEGQTFDAQVTRDIRDASGAVVIPRGSEARVVIKSASKGGRFRGASDLVLDLQSVVINGRPYAIDTMDISQKGKSGVGANKRTAAYTGGGAALGAIVGAIAGGGKGAAIGAGAGAGAGALTQVLTKGGSIKVPAESVLTFGLDKPLRVAAAE